MLRQFSLVCLSMASLVVTTRLVVSKTISLAQSDLPKLLAVTDGRVDQIRGKNGRLLNFHGALKPLVYSPIDPNSPQTFPENPGSLACVAGLTPRTSSCNSSPLVNLPYVLAGSRTIAIVVAYNNPNLPSDLDAYDAYWGLPVFKGLSIVYANGTVPPNAPTPTNYPENSGWAYEASMDVEIAHAMAPSANIILVEAADQGLNNLMAAVDVASKLVSESGGKGEVSMSWGFPDFAGESSYDIHFQMPGVVYVAATGDKWGVQYPSASPYVVAVGGTDVIRDVNGNYTGQTGWSSTGGGVSLYSLPSPAQANIQGAKANRAVPDIAFAAGAAGVWFYSAYQYSGIAWNGPWHGGAGTSVAAPAVAGIINSSGHFYQNTPSELAAIYSNIGNSGAYFDMTIGSCANGSYSTHVGYDICTGIGAPVGTTGK